MGLASVNLMQMASKVLFCVKQHEIMATGTFKVNRGHRLWYQSKAWMELPICEY